MAMHSLLRPRLLPVTMVVLAGLLVVKSVALVRAAAPAHAGAPVDRGGDRSSMAGPGGGGAMVAMLASAQAAEPPPKPEVAKAEAPKGEAPKGEAAKGETKATTAKPDAAAEAAAPEMVPLGSRPVSSTERELLQELRARRDDLDRRDAGLREREAVLAASEQRLTARVAELTALQTKLLDLEKARQERDEANWKSLVKVYETMRPRDAAAIFNELDFKILLQVSDRMKESKFAPVLAAMQPDKARQLTTGLAEMRNKAATVGG